MSEPTRSASEGPPSVRHARRDRAARWGGLLASVLLHAGVFLLWRTDLPAAAEPMAGERPAAIVAGGGAMRAFRVQRPERRRIPPPPRPILAVDVPAVEIDDVPEVDAGPETRPVAHTARLPGIGGGPGEGRGGRSGTGDDYTSPVPRSVFPHWDPPASVRGMEVTVRVFVDEDGRPSGIVELRPPTPDEAFNREIRERIRRMEYRPASRDGEPVAGWAEITFIF